MFIHVSKWEMFSRESVSDLGTMSGNVNFWMKQIKVFKVKRLGDMSWKLN